MGQDTRHHRRPHNGCSMRCHSRSLGLSRARQVPPTVRRPSTDGTKIGWFLLRSGRSRQPRFRALLPPFTELGSARSVGRRGWLKTVVFDFSGLRCPWFDNGPLRIRGQDRGEAPRCAHRSGIAACRHASATRAYKSLWLFDCYTKSETDLK